MGNRRPVKPSTDAKIFRHTAAKTKLMNVRGKPMRGGTRM